MNFFKNLFKQAKSEVVSNSKQLEQVEQITTMILGDSSFDAINSIFEQNFVNVEILKKGFDKAVNHFLDDNVLSNKEEERIVEFMQYFNLSQVDLDNKGSYTRIGQSKVLRQLLEGKKPDAVYLNSGIALPFNLTRNEVLIWLFNSVNYLEDTVQKSYRGGSRGVSVRVAKGVYLRGGSYRGQIIEKEFKKHIGSGVLALTTHNIYFATSSKTIKIPYSKIVGIIPSENGIQITKDGINAKNQYFINIDGVFVYNVITNSNLIE